MTFEKPRGTRDFMPEDMIQRNFVLDTIRKVYETYGYREIETPAFESWSVLGVKFGGGEEISKSIFKFKDYGNRMLGLRFDLTVPMSRFIANNPQLPRPFKRSQIGRVWRYDEPQAGRFREFWQADVDNVGSTLPESDLEPLTAILTALEALGFKDFTVKVNNRVLLEEIAETFGMPKGKEVELFRSIDKLEKLGEAEVQKELEQKGFKNVDELLAFISMQDTPEKILDVLETKLPNKETIEKVREFFKLAKSFGIYKYLTLDLSLARGLAYYTGMVFEVRIKGMDKYGSVAGGGRYDNLIGLYGKETIPATGISMGVERVIEIMKEKKMFKLPTIKTKVLVAPVGETLEKSIKITQKLRKKGIETDIDLMRRGPSKLLAYANSLEIPYVILIGEKEVKANKVTLRDMKTGKQELLSLEKVIKEFSGSK